MVSSFTRALPVLTLILAQIAATPSAAQQDAQGWRALCVAGNEIEILVGGDWYRGTVIGPNEFGEAECVVMTTAYTGREMQFAMAPERMQAVQAPGVPGPRTGPAPMPGAPVPARQVWRALCVPGSEVEILVGSAWYKSIVIGPNEFGEEECDVLNTSYAGSELRFAMAPDRMRAVTAGPVAAPAAAPPQGGPGAAPAAMPPQTPPRAPAPAVTASLADIGAAYQSNTAAARRRYENRTVTLTGTLQSVGSDYARLTDGPFGVAMCNFDEGDRAQLAALEAGSRLTVQGDDTSWGWGTFQLKSCRVLDQQAPVQATAPALPPPEGRPPLGRYVCRQYMTTIGWIDLDTGVYRVNAVEGGWSYDPASGLIGWESGAYAGWPARYEFSPGGVGHAFDEHIIRMTDEGGDLKIDCFLTAG